MQRAAVLDGAKAAVADRGLNYGNPEDNFARIARLWNAHLRNRGIISDQMGAGVREADVALMLGNVKQARLANDARHADSWIDLAGYAACGAEVAKAGAANENAGTSSRLGRDEIDAARGLVSAAPSTEMSSSDYRSRRMPTPKWAFLPESKFGFAVGETVNMHGIEADKFPGTVVGFTDHLVKVQWTSWTPGELHAVRPQELRHGI